MGQRGPKPSGDAREVVPFRLSAREQEQIETIRRERRDDYPADTIRALPMIWLERQRLARTALEMIRGQLSRPDVITILDALNGLYLAHELNDGEMLGQHVVLEVHDHGGRDGCDGKDLARRLAQQPKVVLVALELWAAGLWKRHDEDDLWESEQAWLVGESSADAE